MNDRDSKRLLRDGLLAQEKRKTLDENYREEAAKMFEKEMAKMRTAKRVNIPAYLVLVVIGSVLAVASGTLTELVDRLSMFMMAILAFVIAGMFISSLLAQQTRLELMKEMKELRLEIHELAKKLGHGLP